MAQDAPSPSSDGRNIALAATGAGVSTFGTGLYAVGVVLYIAEQFNSPALVSAFNFLAFAPAALLARPIGNLVDRSSKKRLIVGSDVARGALMLAFGAWAAVTVTPHAAVVLVFGLLTGLGQAVFVPSVHAYMPDLVSAGRLPRANAVRASSGQISNAAGMASAGFLMSLVGLPLLLVANGVSFLLSAIPEAALRPVSRAAGSEMAGEADIRREAARAHGAPQRFRAVLSGDRRLAALTAVNTIMYGLSAPIVVTVPFMLRQASGGAADAGAVAGVGVAGGAGPLTGLVFAAMVLGGLIGFAVASYAVRRWRREGEMIRLALVLGAVALALVALSPAPSTLFIAGPLFGATAAIVHVGVITLV